MPVRYTAHADHCHRPLRSFRWRLSPPVNIHGGVGEMIFWRASSQRPFRSGSRRGPQPWRIQSAFDPYMRCDAAESLRPIRDAPRERYLIGATPLQCYYRIRVVLHGRKSGVLSGRSISTDLSRLGPPVAKRFHDQSTGNLRSARPNRSPAPDVVAGMHRR